MPSSSVNKPRQSSSFFVDKSETSLLYGNIENGRAQIPPLCFCRRGGRERMARTSHSSIVVEGTLLSNGMTRDIFEGDAGIISKKGSSCFLKESCLQQHAQSMIQFIPLASGVKMNHKNSVSGPDSVMTIIDAWAPPSPISVGAPRRAQSARLHPPILNS